MQCSNNLKQLGLAAHNFESAFKHLPSSIRPPGLTPLPRIAGTTLLLPYLEQDNTYQIYDQSLNWHEPGNRLAVNQRIPFFQCPSSSDAERLDGLPEASPWVGGVGSTTDYSATIYVDTRLRDAALVDEVGDGLLKRNSKPLFAEVRDGLSNTIMYAESAGRPFLYRRGKLVNSNLAINRVNGGGWCRPASEFSVDGSSMDGTSFPGPCAINCTNGEDFGTTPFPHPYYGSFGTCEAYAFHPGGAQAVYGDGSVRFISANIDIREFAKMVTRAGREVIRE